jgi:hypothetical protein
LTQIDDEVKVARGVPELRQPHGCLGTKLRPVVDRVRYQLPEWLSVRLAVLGLVVNEAADGVIGESREIRVLLAFCVLPETSQLAEGGDVFRGETSARLASRSASGGKRPCQRASQTMSATS